MPATLVADLANLDRLTLAIQRENDPERLVELVDQWLDLFAKVRASA